MGTLCVSFTIHGLHSVYFKRIEDSTTLLGVPNKLFCDVKRTSWNWSHLWALSIREGTGSKSQASHRLPGDGHIGQGPVIETKGFGPSELIDHSLVKAR
jgi:hypothetical protein